MIPKRENAGGAMQQIEDNAAWVYELYTDVDAMRRDRIGPWLAPNYETRMGNNPPVLGKAAALANSERFWKTIRSMRHTIEDVVVDGDRAVSLAIVTYTRLDGSEVSLPVATYLRRSGPREIDQLWVHGDLAPLRQA
jgi:hypothetical protein